MRKSGHVWAERNASELVMRHPNRSTVGTETGAPPLSGTSTAETCLPAMWCPVYRWRDSNLGPGIELENLLGGGKGRRHKRQPCEAESTEMPDRGGLFRSSEEAE